MAYHTQTATKRDYKALRRLGIVVSILMGLSVAGKNAMDCVARFYPPAQIVAPQEKSYFMTAEYDPQTGTVEIKPPEEVGVIKSIANTLGYSGNMLTDLSEPQPGQGYSTTGYNGNQPGFIIFRNPFATDNQTDTKRDSIDDKIDQTKIVPVKTTGAVYNNI
jgi:hypothetical protein